MKLPEQNCSPGCVVSISSTRPLKSNAGFLVLRGTGPVGYPGGAVLEAAVKFQKIATSKGTPRHNH